MVYLDLFTRLGIILEKQNELNKIFDKEIEDLKKENKKLRSLLNKLIKDDKRRIYKK